MKYVNLFFRRIAKDFRQKELLPLKLLFFIHSSTILIIYPYLTIHMRELGINVEETAIMSAITPVVAIIMPPVAGLIADKIGNFKVLLACFSAAGGAAALLLQLVPVGRITLTYPDQVIFSMSCSSGAPLSLSLYQEHPCSPLHPFPYDTEIKLESCGFVCQAFANQNDSKAILRAETYGLQIHKIKANSTTTVTYELPKFVNFSNADDAYMGAFRTLKNNERYSSSIRKLSKNSYFFPTTGIYNFSCEYKDQGEGEVESTQQNRTFSCVFGAKEQLERMKKGFKQTFKVSIQPIDKHEDDLTEHVQLYRLQHMQINQTKYNTSCIDGFPKNNEYITISVPLHDVKNRSLNYKNLDLGSCAPRCVATSPRKDVCSNKNIVVDIDTSLTFWSYLSVRVFIGMISGTAFAMFEGAVIAILREHKADYGLQRIYATIGGMISSPLSGWLIDFASKGKGYTDYRPIFYLYAVLKILSAFLMLFMNLEFKTPATNVVADVFSILKKVELIALFMACFFLGTAWGYIESFLFWLIQDLGGSKSLMGITITVGGIAGIPLLVLSGPIIKRIGHANVIFIGFIFYAIRLLGYSLIYDPWLCLIFEAMESITSSLSFTAAVTYAARLSTMTTDTSIQAMLGGLYYGVGKGAGSLIGGYLMKGFGTRVTFRIFSVAAAVAGIIYFCFNYFYMRKWPSEGTDIVNKDKGNHFANAKSPNGISQIKNHKAMLKAEELPYEDAITNLGYEDTEMDENLNKDQMQEKKNVQKTPPTISIK